MNADAFCQEGVTPLPLVEKNSADVEVLHY